MPDLTVVIPATDRPATLPKALAAVAAAADGPDQVVVVDEVGLTVTEARNEGVRRARGDVVVFVDADVEVHPDAFARIRTALSDDAVTAVFGSYDDRPPASGVASGFRNLLHHHVHHAEAGPAETFWTGLGAVRRRAFLDVGGFDEQRYRSPSVEDIDLGHRLVASGARIVLDPAIQGTHLKRWTVRSMLWTDFARRGVPWVGLLLRSRRSSAALNLGWRHRTSAAACVVGSLALLTGQLLVATLALAGLVACNAALYSLLVARQGVLRASLGVGLHALHHLVAVAAVPVGVAVVAWEALRVRRRTAPHGPVGRRRSAARPRATTASVVGESVPAAVRPS